MFSGKESFQIKKLANTI